MNRPIPITTQNKPNLLSLGPSLLVRRGDLDRERELDFDLDLDLDLELELPEWDLERLPDPDERLLDLDDEDDELLSLRRFFLLGGEPDFDLERLQKRFKKKQQCTKRRLQIRTCVTFVSCF